MKYARTLLLAMALTCGLLAASLTVTEAQAGPNPVVIMETSMGRIMVMLYPRDAPKTVENFLKYVDAGFYDNTIFHRVIKQRQPITKMGKKAENNKTMNIVQGGGYIYPVKRKPTLFPPIKNEAGTARLNKKGTIAMARTTDPDSATSQFFFNAEDNPVLDYKHSSSQTGAGKFNSSTELGYCAFGKVLRGMDVVEKILGVKTASLGRMGDVPVKPVYLKKAYRAK